MGKLKGENIYEKLHNREVELRQKGRQEAIQERNIEVATALLKTELPMDQIVEISKLDVNSVHQLTLGKQGGNLVFGTLQNCHDNACLF